MLKHTENIPSFEIFEAHFWILVGIKFITARKRSLGQGDAFILRLSFCPGRSLCGGSLSRRVSVQGVSVQGSLYGRGGFCLGGVSVQRPPYGKEQAVPILLECILVTSSIRTLRQSLRVNTYIWLYVHLKSTGKNQPQALLPFRFVIKYRDVSHTFYICTS